MTLTFLVSACGLNERERTVADTNAQIEAVYQRSEELASAIYALPDEPTGPESFSGVITTYRTYRDEVERLNVLIHRLGAVIPEINEHLRTAFDSDAEEAMNRCDAAVSVFERPTAEQGDYQEALTSMCLCVESYATTVTAVSQAYARLAG